MLNLDGRSSACRRYRDILAEFTRDLGGADSISEAQYQLVRRAAMLAIRAELMESDSAAGKPFDGAGYVTLTNSLRRVIREIGLKRVAARQPTLAEHLAARQSVASAQVGTAKAKTAPKPDTFVIERQDGTGFDVVEGHRVTVEPVSRDEAQRIAERPATGVGTA